MKKIFTYSIVAALVAVLFTSCVKERVVYDDSSYWQRGDVVYSNNFYQPWFVSSRNTPAAVR